MAAQGQSYGLGSFDKVLNSGGVIEIGTSGPGHSRSEVKCFSRMAAPERDCGETGVIAERVIAQAKDRIRKGGCEIRNAPNRTLS